MAARVTVVTTLLLLLHVSHVTSFGVSLGIVFDTSNSMADELNQTRAAATKILDASLKNPQEIFHDFILVPYSTPSIGPSVLWVKRADFEGRLANLTATGANPDCPEVTIGAIKEALKLAHDNSYIFVFTDASASDYNETDEVINLIQEKKCKVTFILTGDCGDTTDPGYTSYQQIASASSGEIFSVVEGDVEKVLDAVIETVIPKYDPAAVATGRAPDGSITSLNGSSLEYREVNMMALTFETGNDAIKTPLRIDSHTSDFTVSVVGEKVNVELFDPAGSLVTKYKLLRDLDNTKTYKFEDPEPGTWRLSYSSPSYLTVRVTGSSTLDFDVRFAVEDVITDFDSLLPRPVSGVVTYTVIKMFGLEEGVTPTLIDLINLDGKLISTQFLGNLSNHRDLFLSTAQRPPSGTFNIRLKGIDKNGSPFERISKSVTSAVNATGIEQCKKCATGGTSRCLIVGKVASLLSDTKFKCECKAPYFEGNGETCSNVNECDKLIDNCDDNAFCTDTFGSFYCDCKPGFLGNGVVCTNINECEAERDPCKGTGNCTDTEGSFSCTCGDGFMASSETAPLCKDINECASANGNCEQECVNTAGSFYCQCASGYVNTTGVGMGCTDINECSSHTLNECHPDGYCENEVPGYFCGCNPGYTGSGFNCTDINECEGNFTCPLNSLCRNLPGKYDCPDCMKGYRWDLNKTSCYDINECGEGIDTCPPNSVCNNTIGSFKCPRCMDGYDWTNSNQTACADVNECAIGTHTCPENSVCNNTIGSFECPRCMDGFDWTDSNQTACADVDECVIGTHTCPLNSVCNNTIGSFNCPVCKDGYEWTDSNQTACRDVDECKLKTHTCPENSVCNNTIGSFECPVCKDGYDWTDSNQTACEDVDECVVGTHTCPENSVCNNTIGSFECPRCMDGYDWTDSNQTACEDINECRNDTTNDCHYNATCINTNGGYVCDCNSGYTGNGTNCNDINECDKLLDNCDPKHGVCTNTDGGHVCSCIYGFTGEFNCTEIKPGQTGLEEQQKYLVDSAAVFRMYALEAERQSLEKQLENVLRQCALVARKPTRGKRAVLAGSPAAINRVQVDSLINNLGVAIRKLKANILSAKKACGLA